MNSVIRELTTTFSTALSGKVLEGAQSMSASAKRNAPALMEPRRWAIAFASAFTLFAAFALLGIFLTRAAENVAVFWPANAVIIALGIALGKRQWIPLLAGSFIANAFVQTLMGDGLAISIGMPLANNVEIALMLFGLSKMGLGFQSIKSPSRAMIFICILGLSVIPAAIIGTATLMLVYGAPFSPTAIMWWAADLTSCMIILLPILSPWPTVQSLRDHLSAVTTVIGNLGVGLVLTVGGVYLFSTLGLPATSAIMLPLLWIAMRGGVFATAVTCSGFVLVEAFLVVVDAFPLVVSGETVRAAIFQLQTVSIVTALPVYLVATAVHAHRALIKLLADKEREASQKSDALEGTLASMNQGISCFDKDLRLTVWNAQYAKMFGMPVEQLYVGVHFLDLLNYQKERGNFEGEPQALLDKIRHLTANGQEFRAETELDSGKVVYTIHSPSPGGGWIGTHEDVTERRRETDRVQNEALHDVLTGLPNRRYFEQKLTKLKSEQRRAQDEGIAMLHIDLDHFKEINDTLGHDAGDAMLKHAAGVLKSALRDTDFVARIGGDEFVAICKVSGNTRFLSVLAERLVTLMQEPVIYEGTACQIGASIGIACGVGDQIDFLRVMKQADEALYQAKKQGRSCFVVHDMTDLRLVG